MSLISWGKLKNFAFYSMFGKFSVKRGMVGGSNPSKCLIHDILWHSVIL